MRSSIKEGQGNCQQQDHTSILYAFGDTCEVNGNNISITDMTIIRIYDLTEGPTPFQSEHDYCDSPNVAVLSEYKEASISYIAGYAAKVVRGSSNCMVCCNALESTSGKPLSQYMKLKDKGGLLKASPTTILVCNENERSFRRMLTATAGNLPLRKGIPSAIAKTGSSGP